MEFIVSDYLEETEGAGRYTKYPDISDREHWDHLSKELKAALIESGERAAKEPWTELLISDFREFSKSGNRVRFEDKYFPRRRKLSRLVMAECAENKGRFLDDILDGLYLILEETTWCLPPHTSYERDATQETMPDVTRPIIDLFDAESAALVAYAEYLLRPVLLDISPYISVYVNERLKERIFTPYLNQHFWWMGNGDEPMCNWTPWIVQNVLLCALTRDENFFTGEERRTFLKKAALSCDYFLKDYGEDGGCSEGAGYYSHAGLCLFGCLEIMNFALVTDKNSGKKNVNFDRIFRESKIRNIANYIVKMYVGGGYYINFADCSAMAGRRSAREFLFGKAIGGEALSSFAAEDFRNESETEQLIEDEINLFYHVMQAFSYDEMMKYPKSNKLPEDSWFDSVGLMVVRDETFVLAAKAGNNADSHNHNDVGSFTLYKNGKPFIIDLGVGTYTRKTFSDKRYELWTMQSQFHNLPTFAADGVIFGKEPEKDVYNRDLVLQKDGAEFAAADVECILENKKAVLSMDIADAYDDKRVKSYKRTIELKKGEGVSVKDEYDSDLPVYVSLMSYEKPVANEVDGLCEIEVKDVGTIKVRGFESITDREMIETYPVTDERLSKAWKHEVYRILIKGSPKGKLEFFFA
ncbi:MAG: heparinase II/III-family protein [Butyrivibrio sp.]|nr:heparinase II/III-family protein [Butyrivibrio sp.]